jgi:hypothetical protein
MGSCETFLMSAILARGSADDTTATLLPCHCHENDGRGWSPVRAPMPNTEPCSSTDVLLIRCIGSARFASAMVGRQGPSARCKSSSPVASTAQVLHAPCNRASCCLTPCSAASMMRPRQELRMASHSWRDMHAAGLSQKRLGQGAAGDTPLPARHAGCVGLPEQARRAPKLNSRRMMRSL